MTDPLVIAEHGLREEGDNLLRVASFKWLHGVRIGVWNKFRGNENTLGIYSSDVVKLRDWLNEWLEENEL